MDSKPFNSYSHQSPPDYHDSNPRENDDSLSISPISGASPEDRTPLSAKRGKEPRGAYRPIRHADDAEAYLESVTEAERDLLIGSRFSLDSNDSDDFGDRHLQKQPEKGRKGIRYFLPTWRYALLGVVVILVALFGLWGDVRFLSGPPPVNYVSDGFSFFYFLLRLWCRRVDVEVV